MHDNDDIIKKIDVLHAETKDDIREIVDKVTDLDKKLDIHIEVAKVMDQNDLANKFTRNQKIALLTIFVPIILATFGFIVHGVN